MPGCQAIRARDQFLEHAEQAKMARASIFAGVCTSQYESLALCVTLGYLRLTYHRHRDQCLCVIEQEQLSFLQECITTQKTVRVCEPPSIVDDRLACLRCCSLRNLFFLKTITYIGDMYPKKFLSS